MRKGIIIGAVLLLCALGIAILATSCSTNKVVTNRNGNGTEELVAVEIREYEGKDLSSITDFRENSIKGPQYIDIESYRLKVNGLVENPQEYSFDEVINGHQNYEKVVTLSCVDGWSVTILWEGVLVRDVIEEAQVSPDAQVIIFHAYDGYTTALPIDYIMDQEIMMAHKMNGVFLPYERGAPFQLVAESKWGYKWIKWVTEIELSDDVDYLGTWERQGFSNSADRDEDFF
jgi:DMSO/TMAO reductase YedYZ molybdopterin-dependent catalytic subunit